jgi:mRNA interferase MazF
MARTLRRGDIYLYDFKKPDKTRPVVILSRDDVIPLLNTVMVAPILSTILGRF